MTAVVAYAALACIAGGLIAAALVLARTGDGRLALSIALDFWLAAGLLRLGQAPGWEPLLVTAIIIGIRQLAGRALRRPPVRAADVFAPLEQQLRRPRRG
jgi:uncharacterized membrane protein